MMRLFLFLSLTLPLFRTVRALLSNLVNIYFVVFVVAVRILLLAQANREHKIVDEFFVATRHHNVVLTWWLQLTKMSENPFFSFSLILSIRKTHPDLHKQARFSAQSSIELAGVSQRESAFAELSFNSWNICISHLHFQCINFRATFHLF